MTLFDNRGAMPIAQSRLTTTTGSPHETVPFFLNPVRPLPAYNADGAVMNHVFYTLSKTTRMPTLRGLLSSLKPGGTLVLNEPNRESAALPGKFREWLTDRMVEAAENGSPHNEFDFAFLAAMSSGRLTRDARSTDLAARYPSRAELELMAREAGFEVVERGSTYGGFSTFLVLRKPK